MGKQIDFLACARIRHSPLTIVTGSHAVVGTDHDVLRMPVNLQRVSRLLRTDTRPRKLKKPLGPVTAVNQETLVNLAATHTGPAQGKGYADPADVKALFRMARHSRASQDWKVAFQARRKARGQWESAQLAETVQGNWSAFRKFRKKGHAHWEMGYADANADPHGSVYQHLQGIYKSEERVTPCVPELPFVPISMDELHSAVHGGRMGVEDGTSQELLVGIMNAEGGPAALLKWFNHLLFTGDLPADWYKALMVVLPKTAAPSLPKELRPIGLSSSVSRTFCRVLLQRA